MFVYEINVNITNNLKEIIFLDYLTLRSILLLNKIIQQMCVKILNQDVENYHNYHRLYFE
jgi:hypothetical protein